MSAAIDRRKLDMESHANILNKLEENGNKLIVIDERQQTVLKRLNTINGSIADYQVTKDRLATVCEDIKVMKPLLTTMQIKFYTIVGFTALFTGAIGSAIGAAIVRATTGG